MKTSDALLFALENLSSRRMRTGLSTLGMMFGVAAAIYPAIRASRLDVLQAIAYE